RSYRALRPRRSLQQPSPLSAAYHGLPGFRPCRPPVYCHEAQSLHLRYGPSVALPTLSSCRCLHEPKARFPVEWLCSLPGREFHPLEAPGLSWRTEKLLQVYVHHPSASPLDVLLRCPHRIVRASPRAETVAVLGEGRVESRLQD